jgi:hypothetical protein
VYWLARSWRTRSPTWKESRFRLELGALLSSEQRHIRLLDVDVRVGDPKLDNTHSLRDTDTYAWLGRRYGTTSQVSIEDDAPAKLEPYFEAKLR